MAAATLDQVQQLIDQLSPIEQAKLLEYLTPRITQAIAQQQAATSATDVQHQDAWAELFRVGDTIAAGDTIDAPTLTAAVVSMRR